MIEKELKEKKEEIAELKKAIDKSDIDTETKEKIIEVLQLYVYIDISTQTLAKMRMQIPLIYYAGAIYGLGSAAVAIFFIIPFAVIYGIGVFLVALVGILEVVYARRKLEK